jgi:hypothetical protein
MTAPTMWRRVMTLAVVFVALCASARAETFAECAERAYAQAASSSQPELGRQEPVLGSCQPAA